MTEEKFEFRLSPFSNLRILPSKENEIIKVKIQIMVPLNKNWTCDHVPFIPTGSTRVRSHWTRFVVYFTSRRLLTDVICSLFPVAPARHESVQSDIISHTAIFMSNGERSDRDKLSLTSLIPDWSSSVGHHSCVFYCVITIKSISTCPKDDQLAFMSSNRHWHEHLQLSS